MNCSLQQVTLCQSISRVAHRSDMRFWPRGGDDAGPASRGLALPEFHALPDGAHSPLDRMKGSAGVSYALRLPFVAFIPPPAPPRVLS